MAAAQERLVEVKRGVIDEMGDRAEVVDQVAKRLGADSIAMVARGRRGPAGLIEGSVGERVPCPVLALRHE